MSLQKFVKLKLNCTVESLQITRDLTMQKEFLKFPEIFLLFFLDSLEELSFDRAEDAKHRSKNAFQSNPFQIL